MKIPYYQVDAFSSQVFSGNPAGVCLLGSWLDDSTLQAIAAENNLSETAFVVPKQDEYEVRWFTPSAEVDLCGHATLASGFVLLEVLGEVSNEVCFHSRSGPLKVLQQDSRLVLDFPVVHPQSGDSASEALSKICNPKEIFMATDLIAVLNTQEEVERFEPDYSMISTLPGRGFVITAPGDGVDFVSRGFFPKLSVPEDPVTGSIHCALTPYWAKQLGKNELEARQISARGGELYCALEGDRVLIGGECALFLTGEIDLP